MMNAAAIEPYSLGASALSLLALMHTERDSLHEYKQHQFTARWHTHMCLQFRTSLSTTSMQQGTAIIADASAQIHPDMSLACPDADGIMIFW